MIDPKKESFTIYQGGTWQHTYLVLDEVTNLPKDLTGCTAKLQAREDVADTTPVLDLTGVVGTTDGTVVFTATPDLTIGKTWEKAGYDVELTWPVVGLAPARVDKLGYGTFTLKLEYTRT